MKPTQQVSPFIDRSPHMVRLCGGGPWVHKDVLDSLKMWRAVHGVPLGRGISAAVRFASNSPHFTIQTNRRLKT